MPASAMIGGRGHSGSRYGRSSWRSRILLTSAATTTRPYEIAYSTEVKVMTDTSVDCRQSATPTTPTISVASHGEPRRGRRPDSRILAVLGRRAQWRLRLPGRDAGTLPWPRSRSYLAWPPMASVHMYLAEVVAGGWQSVIRRVVRCGRRWWSRASRRCPQAYRRGSGPGRV